jgi:hypothetical protein
LDEEDLEDNRLEEVTTLAHRLAIKESTIADFIGINWRQPEMIHTKCETKLSMNRFPFDD